jgi:ABC-type glycerol-3-phosphate transport system substrate-binding protein
MRRILAGIVSVVLLLSLCACREQAKDQTMISCEVDELSLPSDCGAIRALVRTENGVFIGSSTKLFFLPNGQEECLAISLGQAAQDNAFIYGAAALNGTLWVLAGQLPPQYTEKGAARENPDFAGDYQLIEYTQNAGAWLCKSTHLFKIDGAFLPQGLIVLTDTKLFCWSGTDIIFLSSSDAQMQIKSIPETVLTAVANPSGVWLHVAGEETARFYQVNGDDDTLTDCRMADGISASYACITCPSEGALLFSCDDGLYRYDQKQQLNERLFQWSDCDLNGKTVTSVVQEAEDTWFVAAAGEEKVWRIQRTEIADNRKVLHLATAGGSCFLESPVSEFNQANTSYRIEIDTYDRDSYDRLCTEIMAGDGPDLFDLSGFYLPQDTPYFEDLYPWIDKDPELSRDDFVPSVLACLTVNGFLRCMPAVFSVTTLSVRKQDVGDCGGWTFEEMCQIMATAGGDKLLLPSFLTREEFLLWLSLIGESSYIDWETHTASFDSQEFRFFLTFCRDLPQTQNASQKSLTALEYIQNTYAIAAIRENYKEDYTLIGFPNQQRNGTFYASDALRFAISSGSAYKEAAWEFIRAQLIDSAQTKLAQEKYLLPIRQDVLEKELANANLTASDRDAFIALLTKPHSFLTENMEVRKIIQEESAAYFDGTKTIEETARLIQNRVMIYLEESY